jgi:glycosyltransferase involved in cell wall biosynthesis
MTDVIHVTSINRGGTIKHVEYMQAVFSDYKHLIVQWKTILDVAQWLNPCIIHIHTIWTEFPNICDPEHYSLVMAYFRERNIPIYITIHDHQWLYPDNPILTLEDKQTFPPLCTHIYTARYVFEKASLIIFPSQRIHQIYMEYFSDMQTPTVVVPHCDIPLRMNQLIVPPIQQSIINVAFIGYGSAAKGMQFFEQIVRNQPRVLGHSLKYHMYGTTFGKSIEDVTFHGEYKNSQFIRHLHEDNIHILLLLSAAEETYCYTLSHAINSGLPIVYLNRGAFKNRLAPSLQPRFFGANTPDDILSALLLAVAFVQNNQQQRDYIEIPESPVANNWYRQNYPILQTPPAKILKVFQPSGNDGNIRYNQEQSDQYVDIYEADLPFYDPSWRHHGYADISCMLHIFHNPYMYRDSKFVAFMNPNCNFNVATFKCLQNMITPNKSIVSTSTPNSHITIPDYVLNVMLVHYNKLFGYDAVTPNQVPNVEIYAMPVHTFEGMMSWMTSLMKELQHCEWDFSFCYMFLLLQAKHTHIDIQHL